MQGNVPTSDQIFRRTREIIMETGRIRDVTTEFPGNTAAIRYARKLRKYHGPKRNWKPTVRWIYGKNKESMKEYGRRIFATLGGGLWCTTGNINYWDGYDGEENLIVSNITASTDIMMLRKITDRYECILSTRSGPVQGLFRNIILLSSKPPAQCYAREEHGLVDGLLRRIDNIEHFEE